MSVSTILDRLRPHVERDPKPEEAYTLKNKLERIQDGLQDAERQGVTSKNVQKWLKDLEDVMYQMDDALDKWETKNLELRIEQSEYEDISDPCEKVRSLLLSPCLSFKHVVGRRELTLEMKALSERLDKILAEKGKYTFVSNESDNSRELKKSVNTSADDESKIIYGRESDKNSLVKLLLSKGEKKGSGQVISILGAGGLGKTTLAQLVFNDRRVNGHFGDLKSWVSVSNPFDASQVAKAILKDFGKSSSADSTLENLGPQIKAAVSNQNFLLVLDNVWTVDRTEWESLKNFLVGEPGCRILVTTRDVEAAKAMGTTHWWRLNVLSDLDCAAILNRIALEGRSREGECEKFYEIGFEIAGMCDGLPQAAMAIGHMLASKFTVQEWEDVLRSPFWKYEDEMSSILRPLRLSYTHLSPVLKRCFLSCVLYPKGSWFSVDELSRIWMAQGYISSSATWDEVQSKGRQYLEELFNRSFFPELRMNGDNLTCKVDNVMHEFANYLARSEYYFILDDGTPNMPMESIARTRNFCARCDFQNDLPPGFLKQLKCVRVLCLRGCGLEELPEEVGGLIHLRYLDLRRNPIKELPETMCDLCNLQTLDLRDCYDLSRLPSGIWKLINLRHLLISGSYFGEYPERLERLTGLWTLDEFRATKESVDHLRDLNQLRGSLTIIVKGLNGAAEAEKANLRGKSCIKELTLAFDDDVSNMDVIEAMVPPPQLQTLYIRGQGKKQLPSWITNTYLNNLKELTIQGFDDCSDLPPLGGLPMLEKLGIMNMKFERLRLEFLGTIPKGSTTSPGVAVGAGFPRLKTLVFSGCFMWEEWEDLQEDEAVDSVSLDIMPLPCLQELQISYCPNLKVLPHNLLFRVATSLHKLTIEYCYSLESRYHKESGADRNKISHVPNIGIFGWEDR